MWRRGLRRLVVDRGPDALDVQFVGVLAVVGGDRPQAVGREELGLVEQLGEHPLEAVDADDAEEQPAVAGLALQQPGCRPACPGRRALVARGDAGNCLPRPGFAASISSSTTAAASIGMTPTIERTLTGTTLPVGGDERS